MNKRKLNKLATFLRTVPRKKFNMESWAKTPDVCSTAGCAAGWATVCFKRWKNPLTLVMEKEKYCELYCGEAEGFRAAAKFFEISLAEADYLFDPYEYREQHTNVLISDITPKLVAKRIEKFVKDGGMPNDD